jgi:hypothetical protein
MTIGPRFLGRYYPGTVSPRAPWPERRPPGNPFPSKPLCRHGQPLALVDFCDTVISEETEISETTK